MVGFAACGAALGVLGAQGCEEQPPKALGGPGKYGVVYQRLVRLRALEETVLLVKSPAGAFAVREDKSIASWRDLQKADRERHRERFGPFTSDFFNQLDAASAEQEFEAAVYFRPQTNWTALTHGASRIGAEAPSTALEELEEATASQAEALASRLSALGMQVSFIGKTMPVVMVKAPAGHLLGLRTSDDLALIVSAAPMVGQNHADGCNGGPSKLNSTCQVDSNIWAGIDNTFNANGYFGAGQRVGIVEAAEGDCMVDTSHEAFAFASFNYQVTNGTACQNPAIRQHLHWVTSVLSASAGGKRCGASDVEVFYANDGNQVGFPIDPSLPLVDTVGCNASATAKAYDWLSSVGDYANPAEDPPISAVNESFGCIHELISCDYNWARSVEGITQDYYAHVYGMPIVKGAGNMNCVQQRLGLRQEACPFTLNSICVGGTASDGAMSFNSTYRNPGSVSTLGPPVQFALDREEPDVVTLGGQVAYQQVPDEKLCVAQPLNGSTTWEGHQGTSLAAPLVTSMITLFREYCEPYLGYRLDQRALRALLRTMAIAGDPADSAYSTPRSNQDYFDGAGMLQASQLFGICNGGSNNGGFGPVTIDLGNGDPVPQDKRLYIPGWTPPGETQGATAFPELGPQDFAHDPSTDTFLVGEMMWTDELVAGSRVRFTFSWDSCPLDDTGDGPAGVSVDFDLFLRRVDDGYVWGSQSLDDNNEGFDYTVPQNAGGKYQVWLMWPEGQLSCEGTETIEGGFSYISL